MNKKKFVSAVAVAVCTIGVVGYSLAASSDRGKDDARHQTSVEADSDSSNQHQLVQGVEKEEFLQSDQQADLQKVGTETPADQQPEQQPTPQPEEQSAEKKQKPQFAGSEAYKKLTEVSGIQSPDYYNVHGVDSKEEETQKPSNTREDLAKYRGDYVEFMGFEDQVLTEAFKVMIFSNLESNRSGSAQYDVEFKVMKDSKEVITVGPVEPGESEIVDLYSRLPDGENKLTIISTAYTADGTKLNALSQEIVVTIEESSGKLDPNTKEYEADKTVTYYTTPVVYVSSANQYTVLVPAVVTVNQGEMGTSFDVGFCAKSIRKACKLSIDANDQTVNNFVLSAASAVTDDLGDVNYSIAGDLAYTFGVGDTKLHWIGPAQCTLDGSKRAGVNYYGIITFKLNREVRA